MLCRKIQTPEIVSLYRFCILHKYRSYVATCGCYVSASDIRAELASFHDPPPAYHAHSRRQSRTQISMTHFTPSGGSVVDIGTINEAYCASGITVTDNPAYEPVQGITSIPRRISHELCIR